MALRTMNSSVGRPVDSAKVMLRSSLLMLLFLLLPAALAEATQGHVLSLGVVYQAATYINHPQYGTHPSYYGVRPEQTTDINIGTNSYDDYGMPLFAPEDGSVAIIHCNTNAWGYSIEWRSRSGAERLFMAHLKRITLIGFVRAGQQIAEIGGTGGWKPHLHIESSKGWLELSGRILQPPINPYGNGMFYVSNGPADKHGIAASLPFFRVELPQQQYYGKKITELGGGSFQ
jgi:hypothetical protein